MDKKDINRTNEIDNNLYFILVIETKRYIIIIINNEIITILLDRMEILSVNKMNIGINTGRFIFLNRLSKNKMPMPKKIDAYIGWVLIIGSSFMEDLIKLTSNTPLGYRSFL